MKTTAFLLAALSAVSFAADLKPSGGDDTIAIQKAADAGGALHFSGTYRLTQTVLIDLAKTGFTSLLGDGTARIVMAGSGPAFRFVGTHGGTADPKSVTDAVLAKERMPMVDGIEIVGENAEADGIEAKGTLQITITRSRLSKLRHGVHLVERNRNVIVSACQIYDNRGVGVFLDDVNLHQTNITGCHISYCTSGGIVTRGGEIRNVHIAGCDIESNMAPDLPPAANVEIDNRGGSTAEVAITGCTLQHNHLSPDSANIRVIGPGKDYKAGEREAKAPEWGHITIAANVFSDVRTNIHLIHARGIVITGNTFWEGFDRDVLVESCRTVVVTGNNFERNPGYELWQKEFPKQGLVFRDSADCTLTGLHINGVRNQPAALVLEKCSRFHVSDCTVLDSDNAGLLLRGVTQSSIHGNFIRDDRAEKPAFQPTVVEGGEGNRLE
jgi:nitrous oxidase accessory protein NosD